MKIEIKIDENCAEPKIIVVTDKINEEINDILRKLSAEQPQILAGFKDEKVTALYVKQIFRIYASGGKVYAETDSDTYILRLRLYETEQRLANQSFVRISNGEIINLK